MALFTAFSAVGINKVVADDTSTITIIKKTNDNTNKDFKFRIKAYKTTETTSYEYKPIMSAFKELSESRAKHIWIYEENITYSNFVFLRNSIYKLDYENERNYDDYINSMSQSYPSKSRSWCGPGYDFIQRGYYNLSGSDYPYMSNYYEDYNPDLNPDLSEYPDLLKKEDYDNYRSSIMQFCTSFGDTDEIEINDDGYYKNKTTITYKGEEYPIYTTNNIQHFYSFPDHETEETLYIRIIEETETTDFLNLSSDSRFTPVGDNVYEFTVKANDSTGVKIDIPVGYIYEIEEVEDSDYTLKSINDDGVFDVKGEMGNDSEKFTFFNESKNEPTPVEPTPRVDKPKYNLPKTGIE